MPDKLYINSRYLSVFVLSAVHTFCKSLQKTAQRGTELELIYEVQNIDLNDLSLNLNVVPLHVT